MTILNRQPSFRDRLQKQMSRKIQEDLDSEGEDGTGAADADGHKAESDDDMEMKTVDHQPAGDEEQELTGVMADPGELPPPSPTPLSAENFEALNGFYPPYRDDGDGGMAPAPKRYSAYYRDEPDLNKSAEEFYDEEYDTSKDRDHLLDPLEMDAVRTRRRNRFSRKDGGMFWTVPWITFCVFVAILTGVSVHYGTKGGGGKGDALGDGPMDEGAAGAPLGEDGTEVTTTIDGDTQPPNATTSPTFPKVTMSPSLSPVKASKTSVAPTAVTTIIVPGPPTSTEAPSSPSSNATGEVPPTSAPSVAGSAVVGGAPTAAPTVIPSEGASSIQVTTPPTRDPFAPPHSKTSFAPTVPPTNPEAPGTYHRDWWAADKLECGRNPKTLNYENAYFHYLYSNDTTDSGLEVQCCDPCYWMYQDSCTCPKAFNESPRLDDAEEQWQLTHQRNLAELTRTMEDGVPLDLIMYGDSITEHLQGTDWTRPADNLQPIRNMFEDMFHSEDAAYRGLALGIGGDVSTWLLWRLHHGEFPTGKLAPRAVWINIGTNEFPMLCNPERMFMGIVAVVQKIHELNPNTAIIVNSILPRCTGGDKVGTIFQDDNPNGVPGWSTQTDWINEQLECWTSGVDGVYFLDNNYALLTDDRKRIRLENMLNGEDCLHPNEVGYKIILQTVQELLHDIFMDD